MKEEKTKERMTLQAAVIKRFMNDEEWAEFRKQYIASRKNYKMANRAEFLEQGVSKEDLDILKVYLGDTDTSVKRIAEDSGVKSTVIYSVVHRAALRILYQHPELLSRIR